MPKITTAGYDGWLQLAFIATMLTMDPASKLVADAVWLNRTDSSNTTQAN